MWTFFELKKVNVVMMSLHWPIPRPMLRQRLRLMKLGSIIMFGSIYMEPRPGPMQISKGSAHIL